MSTDNTATQPDPNEPIVAIAGSYYRNARYIMFVIIVLMGGWFLYDGFVKYPAQNKEYADATTQIEKLDLERQAVEKEGRTFDNQAELDRLVFKRKQELKEHQPFSIALQKILGFTLPPVGVGLLFYWMRKSRGQIKLENGVLSAPDHPAIPIGNIDELDKELWEKKGIAYAYYTLADNTTGKLRLDDFIYQAKPIRAIVKAIEDVMKNQDIEIDKIKAKQG